MYNNQTVSLNTDLNLLSHLPGLIHRQLNASLFEPSVHHLPAQHVIVRVDKKDAYEMNVSIMHELIPFGIISSITLTEDDNFKPVNDTRPLPQQQEISFLAITNQQLTMFKAN